FVSRHRGPGEHFHDRLYTDLAGKRPLERLLADVLAGRAPEPDRDRGEGPRPAWEIDVYTPRPNAPALEPYAAVRQFLDGRLDGEKVIATLEEADLVGMGGAAARTGKKWRDVRDAPGRTRYVICNADESEPGTFKDRELLLHAPHLVIEGMLLVGLTLKASRAYLYVRHEYPEQVETLRAAIGQARGQVPRALQAFPLEVFVSPGLYICGEESALIEVIEGKRAQPRNQPPDIRNNGLFDQPTLVNNVETLAWVPYLLLREPRDAFRKTPRRFFSLSGDVQRPGVFEVPSSCTLGQRID